MFVLQFLPFFSTHIVLLLPLPRLRRCTSFRSVH